MPTLTGVNVGLQIFDVFPSGCLNGRYIDIDTGEVYNEIARKKEKQKPDIGNEKDISGDYYCFYFSSDCFVEPSGGCPSYLEIRALDNKKFEFKWIDKKTFDENPITATIDWIGEGWFIEEKKIIVKYWKPLL